MQCCELHFDLILDACEVRRVLRVTLCEYFETHYGDVIRATWQLKSPANWMFVKQLVQADNKRRIKSWGHIVRGRYCRNRFYGLALPCFMMTSSNGNIFRVTGHLCGECTGPRWIPAQRPVKRSFGVFFDLRLNKRLSKQSWGWWFETLSRPLWRHRNVPS